MPVMKWVVVNSPSQDTVSKAVAQGSKSKETGKKRDDSTDERDCGY